MLMPLATDSFHIYITTHFDVLFAGEAVDTLRLDEVKEFLLCDTSSLGSCGEENLEFVNILASESDEVHFEHVPVRTRLTSHEVIYSIWLDTKASVCEWNQEEGVDSIEAAICKKHQELFLKRELAIKQLYLASNGSIENRITVMRLCVDLSKELVVAPECYKDSKFTSSFSVEKRLSLEKSLNERKSVAGRIFLILNNADYLKSTSTAIESDLEKLVDDVLIDEDERLCEQFKELEKLYAFLKPRNVVILKAKRGIPSYRSKQFAAIDRLVNKFAVESLAADRRRDFEEFMKDPFLR